ncbi:folylpolyglutamate synthase/dihydrofolate synthase family protein [Lachnospiraceae bacterium 45-W7]
MGNKRDTQAYLEQLGRKRGMVLGLASIRELMSELLNVQNKLKFVHVAGTNGKGSVCAFLSSMLTEAGICVGTYTSPAVFGRAEQYRVNGEDIPEEKFDEIIAEVRRACERVREQSGNDPTVFEVETAAAFLYFYRRGCQVVILEAGMGGETDATNIIEDPLVCVLTSISMDHMKFLGGSLCEIARAKAGIIKENSRVVAVKPEQEEVRQVLEAWCVKKHASLTYSDEAQAEQVRYGTKEQGISFVYPGLGEVELTMTGAYQVQNAVCAIETIKILRKAGFAVSDGQIRAGLRKARWAGRFSVLCQDPLLVIDGAHNSDAAKKLRETLKRGFTNYKIIYIIGVLADKEHEEMLKIMLPLAWKVFTVTPPGPRAMDGAVLAQEAFKYHRQVRYCPEIEEAVTAAVRSAKQENAMILAFGSLSYLKELREILEEKPDYDR